MPVYRRFDGCDLYPSFVVAHGRFASRIVDGHAGDARHLTHALFNLLRAQYREHIMNFNDTCFHRNSRMVCGPHRIRCSEILTH